LSPDGRKVAMGLESDGGNIDIWVYEFDRQVMTRLTSDPSAQGNPVWSPDASQVAYRSTDFVGDRQLYRTAAGGGGQEEPLGTNPSAASIPTDWSRDGRWLFYSEVHSVTGADILALPLEGDSEPVVVLQTTSVESNARLSPDGQWMAYQSNASGRPEIYVRPFPAGGGSPWPVSAQGGTSPTWRADGKELFFLAGDGSAILSAAVRTTVSGFESDAPRELFQVRGLSSGAEITVYDVTADGQRFLIQLPTSTPDAATLTVVTEWTDLLAR